MNNSNNRIKMDCDTYTELEGVIQEMDDFVDAVIVEGTRDKRALEELGITKEIEMCASRPDTEFVDYLRTRYKTVAILTDYDSMGKRINKRFIRRLEREGVKVENRYREKIGVILGLRGMKSIESLNSLRRRIL
jgi:5S rRNA maturation endonuclease (ribonuclease M5)